MLHTTTDSVRQPRVRRTARALFGALAVTIVLAATALPSAAFAWKPTVGQVFAEQNASQRMITALVNNEISSLSIGKARRYTTSTYAPVTARMRDGSSLSGTVCLRRYGSRWYFYSITAGAYKPACGVPVPAGISASALRYCVSRQTAKQWFAQGIRYGYYRTLQVRSVSKNWNTATIKFRLSGGTRSARYAYLTCIKQTSTAGKDYWFMTALK